MGEYRDLPVPIRELDPHLTHLIDGHRIICYGEAKAPADWPGDGPRMPFHLALGPGGTRLLLLRDGYPPQELVISDLVSRWLIATGSPAIQVDGDGPVGLTDRERAKLADLRRQHDHQADDR
jgi:hypothetical protein